VLLTLNLRGDINAFAFIKLKLGAGSTGGFASSARKVVEPGNRSIVLIVTGRCCGLVSEGDEVARSSRMGGGTK
jgi:hypothetical protein